MDIEIIYGDITKANVDAIVNAANNHLQEGSGVCGAIFTASKNAYSLQEECDKIGYCETGSAVITKGYKLCKYIIHAVGPIYTNKSDAKLLKSAYEQSLILAEKYNLNSIAFPAISTGVYGYPIKEAAKICINVLKNFKSNSLQKCFLYLYDDYSYQIFYNEYIKQILQ